MEPVTAKEGARTALSSVSLRIPTRTDDVMAQCAECNALVDELTRFVPQPIKVVEPAKPPSTVLESVMRFFGAAEGNKAAPPPIRYTEFSPEKRERIVDLMKDLSDRSIESVFSGVRLSGVRVGPEYEVRPSVPSDVLRRFVDGSVSLDCILRYGGHLAILGDLARRSGIPPLSLDPSLPEIRTTAEGVREAARTGRLQLTQRVEGAVAPYSVPTSIERPPRIIDYWRVISPEKLTELVNGIEARLVKERETTIGIQSAVSAVASGEALSPEAQKVFLESILERCGTPHLPIALVARYGRLSQGNEVAPFRQLLDQSPFGWPKGLSSEVFARTITQVLSSTERDTSELRAILDAAAREAAANTLPYHRASLYDLGRPIAGAFERFKSGAAAETHLRKTAEHLRGAFGWASAKSWIPEEVQPVVGKLTVERATAIVRALPSARAELKRALEDLRSRESDGEYHYSGGYSGNGLDAMIIKSEEARQRFEECAALVVFCAADLGEAHPITKRIDELLRLKQMSGDERQQVVDYLCAAQKVPSFNVALLNSVERQVVQGALKGIYERGLPLCARDDDGTLEMISTAALDTLIERAVGDGTSRSYG